MTLNQSQCGNKGNKQGGGNCTWNRNQSYVMPSHKGFVGRCEYFSCYTFDCGLTKHFETYHQSMEEFIIYLSVDFKEVFHVSQLVDI